MHLRDIQAQRDVADGGLVGVVGQSCLGVVAQREQGRQALGAGGQHQAAGHGAGHKAQAGGILLHVAGAPRGLAGAQHEHELGVVVAGELVQLASTGHFLQHVWEVGGSVDGVGKGLGLDHELGELDLVERAHAVGKLHTRLEGLVALAGGRGFPLLGGFVQAFNGKGLAACAAGGRQRGQGRVAGHHMLGL